MRETVGGVQISRPDKVLFPADGVTKADLADYYQRVADAMLPWLRDRPVAMVRYPDGLDGEAIMQKNVPRYFPDWVRTADVPKQGGTVRQVVCDRADTLIYLAGQACIEVHAFLSRLGRLRQPDQLIFDLDPPDDVSFRRVVTVATDLRGLLEGELGLAAFVKTTGGHGLHVHVPLSAGDDFDAAREFALQVARTLADRRPDLATTEQRRANRGGRIYLDIMRNAYAQLAVGPYSVRARPGAPVATPLSWTELDDHDLHPGQFTIATVPDRGDDPWAPMRRRRFGLDRARRMVARLAA
jgi:bifunctional non-homologous end joining protein LigD